MSCTILALNTYMLHRKSRYKNLSNNFDSCISVNFQQTCAVSRLQFFISCISRKIPINSKHSKAAGVWRFIDSAFCLCIFDIVIWYRHRMSWFSTCPSTAFDRVIIVNWLLPDNAEFYCSHTGSVTQFRCWSVDWLTDRLLKLEN